MKLFESVATIINKLAVLFCMAIYPSISLAQEFYDYSKAEEELKTYTIDSNIVYAVGAVNHGLDTKNLTLDAYVPDGMEEYSKGAILVIHGGGFRNGKKTDANYAATAKYFAERGFVAFSMNYRMDGDKAPAPTRRIAAYVDGKAALRWIHANRHTYGIDSNNVFTFGGSAGAIIALHISVADRETYLTDQEGQEVPEQNNPEASMRVQGVMNFAGGLYSDLHELDNTDPAILTLHGTEDDRAHYYLALEIDSTCKKVNLECTLISFEGEGHMPWTATHDGKSIRALSYEFCVNQLLVPPDPKNKTNRKVLSLARRTERYIKRK